MIITALLLGLLALAGGTHPAAYGINPVQHSEAAATTTTASTPKPPNPVQHSE